MVALAGQRLPHADPALGSADFQRIRHILRRLGAPVEAVAAEIHQAPALAEIILERLHHAFGMVLRMLRGDDDAIGRQRGNTLGVQVMIGDDVVCHADGGQELIDIGVGHPTRRARSAFDGIHQRELPRSRIQHRTELRDQRHAGAIAVIVVAGQPELRVHVGRLAQRSPRGSAFGDFGSAAGTDVTAIDLVGVRRHEQHNF